MPPPPGKGGGGGGGAGSISGTSGNDTLTGTVGDDVIDGLAGDDTLDGLAGNDTLNGGDGFDTLFGGDGDDFLFGGKQDDVLWGGAGSDQIDGGDGYDVAYYVDFASNYDIVTTEVQTTTGKGKNAVTTTSTVYTVTDLTTGDVDTLTNIELILFAEPPATGQPITQGDLEFAPFDGQTTIAVLDNDDVGAGSEPGDYLTVTAIADYPDIFGNGSGPDLIPDGKTLADFIDGEVLNDGSTLYFDPTDNTFTWDPTTAGFTAPAPGEDPYVISFVYQATDQEDFSDWGDVSFVLVFPAPPATVTFEDMVLDPLYGGLLPFYIEGNYRALQTTTAGNTFEARAVSADGDFDFDNDGDEEWRVWTDNNGTTHELNLSNTLAQDFDVVSIRFEGFDAGEQVEIALSDASGFTYRSIFITDADLDGNGVFTLNETGVGQLNVIAFSGDEVFVDDIFII